MWYVIWTLARNEKLLEERIRSDIDKNLYSKCWMPVRIERQKHKGELKDIVKPLFPGYIFMDTDTPAEAEQAIDKLHGQTGIIGFLKNDGVYLTLMSWEREIIERLTGDDGIAGVSIGVISDKKLRVLSGPLKGMEQYVTRIDRHSRKAYLSMQLFGELRHFELSLQVVEKR